MVTIKLLEIRLELEGDEHTRAFTRLFNQHMARWERLWKEEARRQALLDHERGTGDSPDKQGAV